MELNHDLKSEKKEIFSGKIIRGIGGLYTVSTDAGLIDARPRGLFRKTGVRPMVGDDVTVTANDTESGEFTITSLHPRRNAFVRPAVANADCVLFVIAAKDPKPDLLLLDKLILCSRLKNTEQILVVNKSDIDGDAAAAIVDQYKNSVSGGIFVVSLEGIGGEKDAMKIKNALPEGVTVLCGQSGVGKSTLTNRLLDRTAMETGSISAKSLRGKHTTRHSELFDVGGGRFVIDSPGFSLFDALDVKAQELPDYYPEFENREPCRFMDCSHTGEPDCCVRALLSSGKLSQGRYERYIEIYRELREKEKNKYK